MVLKIYYYILKKVKDIATEQVLYRNGKLRIKSWIIDSIQQYSPPTPLANIVEWRLKKKTDILKISLIQTLGSSFSPIVKIVKK